jgi:hypothetical protein
MRKAVRKADRPQAGGYNICKIGLIFSRLSQRISVAGRRGGASPTKPMMPSPPGSRRCRCQNWVTVVNGIVFSQTRNASQPSLFHPRAYPSCEASTHHTGRPRKRSQNYVSFCLARSFSRSAFSRMNPVASLWSYAVASAASIVAIFGS